MKKMINKTSLLITLLLTTLMSTAQINVQWESRFDGTGNGIDKVVDFELDATGNTFVTGTSFNGTDFDIVTIKYDNSGNELWTNIYGGTGLDEARALAVDNNGDVVVTGARFISGGDWDIFVLKIIGATGIQDWNQIYGGSTMYDIGNDVAVNASNEIYIVGNYNLTPTDLDYIVIKYSATGTELAVTSTGGSLADEGLFIALDASSNVYLGGTREYASTTTYYDFRIMKFTSDLSTITWTTYGDSGFSNIDTPNAMTLDASGNIYIGGQGFVSTTEQDDYLVMKLNNSGVIQWQKMYGGNDGTTDKINALVVDEATGNLFVTGKSKSTATAEDYYTIAYDAAGNELWADRYSTPGLGLDEATDIKISASNGLYVTGYSNLAGSNNDYYTIKYDLAGNEQWATRFDGPAGNSDKALKMRIDGGDNIYISGTSHGGASTNLDYSTIKYCQLETTAPADVAICVGQSTNLVATSVGSLGSNFQWSVVSGEAITGTNFSCTACSNPTASPSITTTYTVSSESTSGCVDYDTVIVTVNSIPTPSIYNDSPLAFCAGGSVELYTDTYVSYTWNTPSIDSFTVANTPGIYTVTITDGNGCQNSANTTVSNYALPAISAGMAQTICPENTAQLLATGAISYVWDVDPTLSQLLIDNPVANPTSATTYTVTGTDGNNCTNTSTVTISLHSSPVIEAGLPTTICVNDSTQLVATGASTYLWDAASTMPIQNIDNPWVYPTSQTKYIVTGTDVNNCTARDSVTISTNNLPFISAGVDQTICEGDSAHIFATGVLTYAWQADPSLSDLNSSNPWATAAIQTSYIVEGEDINGCKNTDTVIVFVNLSPAVSAGVDTSVCIGNSINLLASGAVSYLWTASPTLSPVNVANPSVDPTTITTYTVQGTDINGCKATNDVQVSINSLPIVSAGIDAAICENDSIQLNASGADSYVWTFNPTLASLIGDSPWAEPVTTTTYTVQGTDLNGCNGTGTVTISVNPIPLAPSITQDSIFVISDSIDGNQWYMDDVILATETNDTLDYTSYGNGEYTIIYTDANGCSSSSDAVNATIEIVNVSIEEEVKELKLNIYPNPTIELINIESSDIIDEIVITDLNGKIVYLESNIQQSLIQVNLSELRNGVYLIRINSGENYNLKKIIKQ